MKKQLPAASKVRDDIERTLCKLLPQKFVKHYVRPLIVRRRQVFYEPKKFFESWYKAAIKCGEFSDGITISLNYNHLFARYHYNAKDYPTCWTSALGPDIG